MKMDEKTLAEKAAEKRREYKRQWNAKNRDKIKEHVCSYWERKVLKEGNNRDTDTIVNA
jgi:hypothetical protein